MLARDSAAAALRSDLARHPSQEDFGALTSFWAGYVSLLMRGARAHLELPPLLEAFLEATSTAFADVAIPTSEDHRALSDAYLALRKGDLDAFSAASRSIVAHMEDAGALALADTALEMLLLVRAGERTVGVEERGRIVAHRARLARQGGDVELAREQYELVAHLARKSKSRELAARAWIGFAVLALYRGNYPESEKWFTRAARAADASGVAELSRTAHHGCFVVAAKRKDFDRALDHGWKAFRFSAGDPRLEAEALSNIGGVMTDMGALRPALAALEAALRRDPPARIAIPALAGAMVAAARLGDGARTRARYAQLRQQVESGTHKYEETDALLDAAVALLLIGDTAEAERVRAQALDMAVAGQFHEFQFRAERLLEEVTTDSGAPAPMSRASRVICDRVEQLDAEDLLEHSSA